MTREDPAQPHRRQHQGFLPSNRRAVELPAHTTGAGGALALVVILGEAARFWQASPAGDQLQALFGTFDIGWGGALSIVLIGGLVSLVTAIVSRVTVRRYLAGSL